LLQLSFTGFLTSPSTVKTYVFMSMRGLVEVIPGWSVPHRKIRFIDF
jgi:hypothetical protein